MRFAPLALALGALVPATLPAVACGDEPDLAEKRWREEAFGLSLRPPREAKLVPVNTGDTILRIRLGANSRMALSLKRSDVELTLERLRGMAVQEMAMAHPSAVVLDEGQVRTGSGLEGLEIYFRIPRESGEARVEGQAFFLLSPKQMAMLTVEVPRRRFEETRALFEAVIASLRHTAPAKLNRRREKRIERGRAWREAITPERIEAALVPERWFRIRSTDSGKDVGYARVREMPYEAMDEPGFAVRIQRRIVRGKLAEDTLRDFFVSRDGGLELFSVKTTVRERGAAPPKADRIGAQSPTSPESASRAQTGLRERRSLTVTRQSPTHKKTHRWSVPDRGYLSQVHAHLVPRLWIRHGAAGGGAIGFYAYLPRKGKLSFRSYQLERRNGRIRVRIRPGPELAPEIQRRRTDGALIERSRANGHRWVPDSRESIARDWRVR